MAGAETLGLLDALDGDVRALAVGGGHECAHLVGVAAHDDHDAAATARGGGVDDPAKQRLPENLVTDLGVLGLHARALAGGEDDGRG